jgi:hypothetical protein
MSFTFTKLVTTSPTPNSTIILTGGILIGSYVDCSIPQSSFKPTDNDPDAIEGAASAAPSTNRMLRISTFDDAGRLVNQITRNATERMDPLFIKNRLWFRTEIEWMSSNLTPVASTEV